jgi:hypothetical protein
MMTVIKKIPYVIFATVLSLLVIALFSAFCVYPYLEADRQWEAVALPVIAPVGGFVYAWVCVRKQGLKMFATMGEVQGAIDQNKERE